MLKALVCYPNQGFFLCSCKVLLGLRLKHRQEAEPLGTHNKNLPFSQVWRVLNADVLMRNRNPVFHPHPCFIPLLK